jgi:hypothetical protein
MTRIATHGGWLVLWLLLLKPGKGACRGRLWQVPCHQPSATNSSRASRL